MSDKEAIIKTLDCLYGAVNNLQAICEEMIDRRDRRNIEAVKALYTACDLITQLHAANEL